MYKAPEATNVSICKWGNSQGIRITQTMLDYLHARNKSELEISYEEDGILLKKNTERKTLEEYAAPYGGKLGPYEEFEWGDGLGFERWIDEKN